MRASSLVIAAAAVASATEIRFAAEKACGGTYVACSDIDSTTCCIPGAFYATTAQFINTPVRAILAAFEKNDTLPACSYDGNSVGQVTDVGSTDCLTYTFGIGSARWKEYGAGKEACTKTKTVDVLVFDGATKYGLDGMDEGMQKRLLGIAGQGLKERDVPAEFDEFKVGEWQVEV